MDARADGETIVSVADSSDRAAWTDYVAGRADATLFHDLRWGEAVEATYGYRPLNLIARRHGRIVGALPLIDVRSVLFGRSLISSAFAIGGGVLADDEDARVRIGSEALKLGREFGVTYVELRGGASPGAGWTEKSGLYAAFSRMLPERIEDILPFLPKNRRAEIKKAVRLEEEAAFRYRLDGTAAEFHPLYAESLRHLGTPVFPASFIENLLESFGADAEIAVVDLHGAPAAALMTFWRGARVMPYYIGGTQAARSMRAFDYLYYRLMVRAIERGARNFDFGRSKVGSTHFNTKTHWGFEPTPVVYHVGLIRAKTLPNVNPTNPKFALISAAWKRLPGPVANALGPHIARHLA